MNPDNTEETIIDDSNKAPDAPSKEVREKKRQELNARIAQVVEIVRKKGTKERGIGAILMREFEHSKQGKAGPLGNEPPGTILRAVSF
jgi:hypothetical protein